MDQKKQPKITLNDTLSMFCPSPVKLPFWRYEVLFRQQRIAKWTATVCRPICGVEDEALRDIIQIASSDTVITRTHKVYETERTKLAKELQLTTTVTLLRGK